jgi:hypothetical protein
MPLRYINIKIQVYSACCRIAAQERAHDVSATTLSALLTTDVPQHYSNSLEIILPCVAGVSAT